MSEDVEWIGRTFTSDVGWELLYDLAEIGNRLGASDGERRGHERVAETFESVGVRDVHEEPFDIPKWERGDAGLSLSAPTDRSFDAIALPGSPAGEASGEIVHLGYGLVDDFEGADLEGKIVVARSDVPKHHDRWMHRREKYYRAYEGGAEAFVFQNHVPGCLPPTGSLGGSDEVMGPLPAIGVSKEAGERIAMYAGEGTVTGDVSIDVTVSDGESRNTVGTLGPDTDEEVIVCAHVDGHDISEGALDNASGTAVLSEVARALAEREDELDRRVTLIGFGSEELGLIGSERYAAAHDLDDVVAVVNCDGAGRARDLIAKTCGFPGMRDAAESVVGSLRHPVQIVPGVNTHSDHWPFVQRGVPGVQIQSDTGDGRGFGHTFADTLDKTDPRAIREHGIHVTRLVEHLANGDRIASRDPDGIAEELRANDLETPMRVAGDWPF
ncbi:M28 family peptidase [Halorubrum sp. JWXQ-INN 858]|uniref:M28 family peptidase n=1 Tax=Halorubrum sp. JWXQ-INN 858 TaxID=2690782 RepID=UPI0013597D7B|nr:M28 family metallopeptidase [Halorubrum sp. JWXQ-INN 858]MWV63262.1 M28 family peptidase [Halorubrum sp. JWXQ-INN 858]